MAVKKCLDLWIIGWLDNYKVKEVLFLYKHRKNLFYKIFKSLCHYDCTKTLGSLNYWMITKLRKVVFCTWIKKVVFIKLLKAFSIMAVQKRLDPCIIGWLQSCKKVIFCTCIDNTLFYQIFKSLCHYGCMKTFGSFDD